MWHKITPFLKEKIGPRNFDIWFSSVHINATPQKIFLEVPNALYKEWIETNYLDIIKEAFFREFAVSIDVEISVNASLLQMEAREKFKKIEAKFINQPNHLNLNSRYTFENFVVGPSNKMSYTTSQAVALNPGRNYNPLFICGGVGLGKTHLMQAIAHEILKKPGAKVVYTPYEHFLNELIVSIQKKNTDAFKKRYRNVDILLIDDIQFIAKNDFAQDEFFNTFNALYDNHKQIIISSDRYPNQIPKVEQRLVSRFSWGLVIDIQPPDLETRIAILKKKLEHEPVAIDDRTLHFLAESFTSNIRELEGALIRLIAYSLFENTPITIERARIVLKDIIQEQKKTITPDKIIDRVSAYFSLDPSFIKSKKRNKTVIIPKQICMYLIREYTELSYPEIGLLLGAKHHTTILHAYNKVKNCLGEDKKMAEVIHTLVSTIKSE